jgi:serine/threonine-protein kinase RsbW
MEAADDRQLFLPSRAAALSDARRFVDQVAERAGFVEAAREEISLAVTEAVSNAIRYGSPAGEADQIELRVAWQAPRLVTTVRDHGPLCALPPPSLPDPASFADHGRGRFLMHQLMDEVRYEWDAGMVVRMIKEKQS